MALVNSNFRESTVTQSWYDSLLSTYDVALKPQELGEVIHRYGEGLYVTNFLHLAGQTMDVKSPTIKIIEQGAPNRPLKVSIATDAAPVNGTTVTIDVADGSDAYARANFTLIIPKAYTNKDYDTELVLSGSAGSWTGTMVEDDTAITTALSDVYVFEGGSLYGKGTDQPEPMASGYYERSTNERIMKDTSGIEGGRVYQEEWESVQAENGKNGVWNRAFQELDYRLDCQIDAALLIGKETDNANLTSTSVAGGTSAIPSADGLIPIMKQQAQEQTWTTAYDIDKFREVKTLLENVGIVNKKVDFMVGTDLNASIETSMIDFLKTNSAGHSFYDMVNSVGFVVKEITINGVQFYVTELASFANPNRYGLSSYGYRDMGFIFPQGKYSVKIDELGAQQELRLPHLTLGYAKGKNEDRRRPIKVNPGMNGFPELGDLVANGYDGVKFYTLTHIVPIWTHMYKTIIVEKDAAGGGGS